MLSKVAQLKMKNLQNLPDICVPLRSLVTLHQTTGQIHEDLNGMSALILRRLIDQFPCEISLQL